MKYYTDPDLSDRLVPLLIFMAMSAFIYQIDPRYVFLFLASLWDSCIEFE